MSDLPPIRFGGGSSADTDALLPLLKGLSLQGLSPFPQQKEASAFPALPPLPPLPPLPLQQGGVGLLPLPVEEEEVEEKNELHRIVGPESLKLQFNELEKELLMDYPEILFKLLRPDQKQTVYTPEVKRVTDAKEDGDFDKFGGIPSVDEDFEWPVCEGCKRPLQFFFQLTDPRTGRTYQLFSCVTPDCPLIHDAGSYLIRYIDYEDGKATNMTDALQRAKILTYAYSYKEDDKAYHHGWLGTKYCDLAPGAVYPELKPHSMGKAAETKECRPFQCFRVIRWVPREEIAITKDELVAFLRQHNLVAKDTLEQAVKEEREFKEKYGRGRMSAEDFVHDYYGDVYHDMKVHGEVIFGGSGESAQGEDYSRYALHFTNTDYLPYMWGDSGYAHVSDFGELAWDCY
ncbi:Hypothetical protein POVN_LOCUS424 [uncultured virus]|nr:Hypothetical protein POVN_LOCUS424 [uncultured virus]